MCVLVYLTGPVIPNRHYPITAALSPGSKLWDYPTGTGDPQRTKIIYLRSSITLFRGNHRVNILKGKWNR